MFSDILMITFFDFKLTLVSHFLSIVIYPSVLNILVIVYPSAMVLFEVAISK
jgi:hypothetical protein